MKNSNESNESSSTLGWGFLCFLIILLSIFLMWIGLFEALNKSNSKVRESLNTDTVMISNITVVVIDGNKEQVTVISNVIINLYKPLVVKINVVKINLTSLTNH